VIVFLSSSEPEDADTSRCNTQLPTMSHEQLDRLTGPVVSTKRVGGAMGEEALLAERTALYTLVVEEAAEVRLRAVPQPASTSLLCPLAFPRAVVVES
jgi:hypothetical protein